MMHKKITTVTHLALVSAMLTLLMVPFAQQAWAFTSITTASDIMSSSKDSTGSNHEIKAGLPTVVGAGGTILYTFPAGFNLTSIVLGDIDFATGDTSTCSTATYTEHPLAASGGSDPTWNASVSGQVITITVGTGGTTAVNNCVRLRVGTNTSTGGTGTHQITNPTAGSYAIHIGPTPGNNMGDITVNIISNDQVAVSGLVGQSLTFSLGSNSVTFSPSPMTTSAPSTASHTLLVTTNAASGMAVTVTGSTLSLGGLGVNNITAMGGTTSSVGTKQFGLNLASSNATPAVGAAPSGSAPIGDVASGYGTNDNFKFVSGDTIASSTGAINTTTYTVGYMANISGTTTAGSYSTTLTYTATATF
ncbi:MAG: hypothetical protein NTX63_03700 [Candidatus Peregrinibacteria bacterium]|nr:hypothetical protein [Candidatus Peregrinibacteria bacterium]